jgi:hypothetical protein
MRRAVSNAFEERGTEASVRTGAYYSVQVAHPEGRAVPRHRAAELRVTIMEHYEVATPTPFTALAEGVGDDIGDHDSPEYLSGAVCETGWRLWAQATGEDL